MRLSNASYLYTESFHRIPKKISGISSLRPHLHLHLHPHPHIHPHTIKKLRSRTALRTWTTQWQKTPESSLDPRNPNGPVTLTSTALLGLAYVRLAFDMAGPAPTPTWTSPWTSTSISPWSSSSSSTSSRIQIQSRILTWDAARIATHLHSLPPLPPSLSHSPHLLPAVLHAAHALSIPVKLGVDFVVRCHAYSWSVQHSLCGVEFAVLLSKWILCISTKSLTGASPPGTQTKQTKSVFEREANKRGGWY